MADGIRMQRWDEVRERLLRDHAAHGCVHVSAEVFRTILAVAFDAGIAAEREAVRAERPTLPDMAAEFAARLRDGGAAPQTVAEFERAAATTIARYLGTLPPDAAAPAAGPKPKAIRWLGDETQDADAWEITHHQDRLAALGSPTTLYFTMDDGTRVVVPRGWWVCDLGGRPYVSSAPPASEEVSRG